MESQDNHHVSWWNLRRRARVGFADVANAFGLVGTRGERMKGVEAASEQMRHGSTAITQLREGMG